MKKKTYLFVLPVLVALSACTNISGSQKSNNLMAEDTLAHEDIFGAAEEARFEKKGERSLSTLTSDFVKVGYQIKYNDKDTLSTEDDTISIRFVAALKSDEVLAYWSRGLAQPNGWEGAAPDGENWKFKFNDGIEHESTVKYTALNNGASRIVAGEGDFKDYSCFVIYTLTNIPYEDYKDSYLGAYVTLIDESNGENLLNSKGVAVKVEKNGTQSKNRFYFDPNTTGHFLQGTINGVLRDGSDDSTHSLLRASEHEGGHYYASFENVSFDSDDCFGSYYFSPSHFQFFGSSYYFSESGDYFSGSVSLSEYCSPINDGSLNLKVYNDSTPYNNHVFASSTTAGDPQKIYLKMQNWLTDASAVMIANIEGGNGNWFYAEVAMLRGEGGGDDVNCTATLTVPNNIRQFELLRCAPGTTTSNINWDDHSSSDPGRIWNITNGKINVSDEQIYGFYATIWRNY